MRKPKYRVLLGDNRKTLPTIPDSSISCCVTSPPYYGLRDYGGMEEQIGLEATPEEYVAELVKVFEEVKRVLRDDGTLWLNIGDTHYNYRPTSGDDTRPHSFGGARTDAMKRGLPKDNSKTHRGRKLTTVKQKDLIGIPWMLAFALRSAGWYLRQDIIWSKPNPMPESVGDRCTKAHEYVFLLTKKPRYYFDKEAAKESAVTGGKRKRRSVWHVPTVPYKGAHFATFPPELIEPCIRIGAPKGSRVLDPFGGSGTTAGVALALGCDATLCELDPNSAKLVKDRVKSIGRAYKLKLNKEQDMEIQLSVSAVKPKTYTMSAADTEAVAQELLPKLQRRAKDHVAATELEAHATELVSSWVKSAKTRDFSPEARSKSAGRIVTKMLAAFKKLKGGNAPEGIKPKAKASAFDNVKLPPKGTRSLTAAEVTAAAESLLPTLKGRIHGPAERMRLGVEASMAVANWVNSTKVKEFSKDERQKAAARVIAKLVALFKKPAKKAPTAAPKDKVVPVTKAATKEEKLKAQILAGTKLRNQFAGMLTTKPALTAKSIETLRKHCEAYFKVITSVQKGNKDLAETTKIEGLRGIDSVKQYVHGIYGLTYGYVELAKLMAGTQADFRDRVMAKINTEDMTKVEQRRTAKANAQRALLNVTKQLGKRGCSVPAKFNTEMQRIFSVALDSGDFKSAKAEARALIDGLVSDAFSNKVKLYQVK